MTREKQSEISEIIKFSRLRKTDSFDPKIYPKIRSKNQQQKLHLPGAIGPFARSVQGMYPAPGESYRKSLEKYTLFGAWKIGKLLVFPKILYFAALLFLFMGSG